MLKIPLETGVEDLSDKSYSQVFPVQCMFEFTYQSSVTKLTPTFNGLFDGLQSKAFLYKVKF